MSGEERSKVGARMREAGWDRWRRKDLVSDGTRELERTYKAFLLITHRDRIQSARRFPSCILQSSPEQLKVLLRSATANLLFRNAAIFPTPDKCNPRMQLLLPARRAPRQLLSQPHEGLDCLFARSQGPKHDCPGAVRAQKECQERAEIGSWQCRGGGEEGSGEGEDEERGRGSDGARGGGGFGVGRDEVELGRTCPDSQSWSLVVGCRRHGGGVMGRVAWFDGGGWERGCHLKAGSKRRAEQSVGSVRAKYLRDLVAPWSQKEQAKVVQNPFV